MGKRIALRLGFTARAVVLACVLLLLVNLVLGYSLVNQSMSVIKALVNERMLDVSNTAAAMIDGDEYETLTADDKDTEAYRDVYDTLAVFRDNIDLAYIYGVRTVGDREFAFTIDPSYGTPGYFGQEIAYTDALYSASKGTAAVDEVPYSDEWGRFYSAYSPIFNSAGNVVGMVSVDFNASWYEDQIATHARTVIIIAAMSLLVGALVVLLIMSRFRRRFRKLYGELSDLAVDVENLTREVAPSSAMLGEPGRLPPEAASGESREASDAGGSSAHGSDDDIDALGGKIRAMQHELRTSIERVSKQAYSDTLTGVGSMAAYAEAIVAFGEMAAAGTVFSVAVFDINGLKEANDSFGHEEGDRVIIDTANAIMSVFGCDSVFRVGGDEFVVLLENANAHQVKAQFAEFDAALADANARSDRAELPVAVSKGFATYDAAADDSFRAVLRRADQRMYADKSVYYERHGSADRRRAR